MIKNIVYVVFIGLIIIFVNKQCDKEPKTVIKTVTKIKEVRDTIITTKIDTLYKEVYLNRYIDKGETKIIYTDKPNDTTIVAKQYTTELKSNNATAKLNITALGEVLDVSGVIHYKEKETTKTVFKTQNKSGLYIYGSASINRNIVNPEIGLMYQFKNKIGVMGGVQYDNLNNVGYFNVGLLVKL